MITDLEPDAPGETKAGDPEVQDRGHRVHGGRPPHSNKEAHVPFAPPEFTNGKTPTVHCFDLANSQLTFVSRNAHVGKSTWWYD